VQLTFHGGKELARALRDLPKAIAEEVLETAVVAGAGIIRQAAADKAPRNEPRRRPGTVRLADSMKVAVTEKSHAFVTVCVYTKVSYAHLIEYGHQIVARGPTRERVSITLVSASGRVSARFGLDPTARAKLHDRRVAGSLGFVAPRPFLRPAFDENRETALRRIGEVLGKGIEVEARRVASTASPARAA